jgi:hypothetical protein
MPRLLITCTKCERKIYTGLTFEDWFVFEWVDIQGATSNCRACGTSTSWDKSSAYLESDGGGD